VSESPFCTEVVDQVAVITLNRPDVRNAFGGAMATELSEAFRRSDADDGCGPWSSRGRAGFCAGADMSAGADTFARRDEETFSAAATTMPAWEVRKLVIAPRSTATPSVSGSPSPLQCDIRIFAADATYGIVQTRGG